MKHIINKDHTEQCTKRWENGYYSRTIKYYLLYANNDFILLTHCECLQGYVDDREWIISLLENKAKKNTAVDFYEIDRGGKLIKGLRKEIIENTLFENVSKYNIDEVNYIYSTATGDKYCITSKIKYLDRIHELESFENNYKKAIDQLKDLGLYEAFSDRLSDLYYYNKPVQITNNIYDTNSIKEMVRLFNKLLKRKKL